MVMAFGGVARNARGLATEVNKLANFLALDPAIDLKPNCKATLDYIEERLHCTLTVYNRRRRILYYGGKSLLLEYREIALLWSQRTWALISDSGNFLHEYHCEACPQMFDHACNLTRHKKSCPYYQHFLKTGEIPTGTIPRQERVLEGVWRSSANTLVDDLNRVTQLRLTAADLCQQHMACFDCESALMRSGDIFSGFPHDTRITHYVSNHQLFCVGVVSSLPGYTDTKVFIRSSQESAEFVQSFVEYLLELADRSYVAMKVKLRPVFDRLADLYRSHKATDNKPWMRRVCHMTIRLDKHCKIFTVAGYNIFRYDITLLKRQGFLDLLNRLDGPVQLMKRSRGTYLTITCERLKFVDQINFTGPVSLRSLLQAFAPADQKKSYFPYNKIRKLSDLGTGLPVYEDFEDV